MAEDCGDSQRELAQLWKKARKDGCMPPWEQAKVSGLKEARPIALHSRSKAARTEPTKFVRLQKASAANGCRLHRLEDLKASVE